jgi:C4-dicarboxylate-specific signal transduction histidine kinase
MWWARKYHHGRLILSKTPYEQGLEDAAFALRMAYYAFPYVIVAAYIIMFFTGDLADISSTSPWALILQILSLLCVLLLIREAASRRAAENELAVISEFADAGVWRWQPARNRLRLSTDARRVLGQSGATPVRTLAAFLQVFRPEDRPDVERGFVNAIRHGAQVDVEAQLQCTKGGTPRWLRIRAEAAESNFFHQSIGILTDVSTHKLQESKIEQMHDELARCMRSDIIGGLSGALVHELKQPLSAILSNAQAAERMLRRSPIDVTELTHTIKDIIDDDSRAGDVITHLRSLLRNDDKVWKICDINDVVSDSLKILNGFLNQRQIRIAFNSGTGSLNIRGNRVQLQQVILNLVINAAEAMNDGRSVRRSITITTYNSRGVVAVSVKDCGLGIPKEIHGRIFDPFFTTKAQGLGLGLSICRSIVSAHRGWLEAISEKDRGTTFIVTLPVAQEESECQTQRTRLSS